MKGNIEERCILLAQWIIEQHGTVRSCAKRFAISKSTVHTVVTLWNGNKKRCFFQL